MGDRKWIDDFYSEGILSKYSSRQMALLNENANIPFYQYRSGEEYDLKNIRNNAIWASAVERFNDPYDCDFNVRLIEEKYHYFERMNRPKEMLDTTLKLREGVLNLRRSTTVSCFSEKNDSILMWSHYSDKHKGICVCYDLSDLLRLKKLFLPVWYKEEKINPYEKQDDGEIIMNPRIKEIFIQKSLDWEYEKEWRIINFLPEEKIDEIKDKGGMELRGVQPKRIILGACVSEDLKREVIKLGKECNINVTGMVMDDESFKLNEDINYNL